MTPNNRMGVFLTVFVILVLAAGIYLFRPFEDDRNLGHQCLVSNEFRCADRILNRIDATHLDVLIAVSTSKAAIVSSALVNSTVGNGICSVSPSSPVERNGKIMLTCPLVASPGKSFLVAGEKMKIDFTISYKETGSEEQAVANGEIIEMISCLNCSS